MIIGLLACCMSAATGCRGNRATAAQENQVPAAACASLDSLRVPLRYSALKKDSVTQDLTGFEIMLRVSRGNWAGVMQEAVGQLGEPQNLRDLKVNPKTGVISFRYLNGADTASFEGRFSCDSLWGTWRPYPGVSLQQAIRRAPTKPVRP